MFFSVFMGMRYVGYWLSMKLWKRIYSVSLLLLVRFCRRRLSGLGGSWRWGGNWLSRRWRGLRGGWRGSRLI